MPKKNVRLLRGKPLITHTIESSLAVPEISSVFVTTNCEEVVSVVNDYPISLISRPDNLALDDTPTFPVIEHALAQVISESKIEPDLVLLLQCTSPLRRAHHIAQVIELFGNSNVSSVISVIEVGDEHPARMYQIDSINRLIPLNPDLVQARRQELPRLYRRNGAIYAIRYSELLKQKTFITAEAIPYVMDPIESVNIDTELDLIIAEAILNVTDDAHE